MYGAGIGCDGGCVWGVGCLDGSSGSVCGGVGGRGGGGGGRERERERHDGQQVESHGVMPEKRDTHTHDRMQVESQDARLGDDAVMDNCNELQRMPTRRSAPAMQCSTEWIVKHDSVHTSSFVGSAEAIQRGGGGLGEVLEGGGQRENCSPSHTPRGVCGNRNDHKAGWVGRGEGAGGNVLMFR